MKHIGLIQFDGTLPNLALMKLSAYHKAKGDRVHLMISNTVSKRLIRFDKVYISCIFEENREKALALSRQFLDAEIGGIGVNNNRLPEEIEHQMPDYDTFKCDYSIGFTSRGCLRNCDFCKVRQTEGHIRSTNDIYEFWDRRHKHLMILDNNILALPKHFRKIADQVIAEKLSVDFNQGLDIRLLNPDNSKILSELNVQPHYRFAFDSMDVEPYVLKGIKTMQDAGIVRAIFYVLVGFNTTPEQDLHRLELLKSLQQRAYVMRYNKCIGSQWYNDLGAWANQQKFFMSMDFETFRKMRHNRARVIPRHKPGKNNQLRRFIQ